MTTEDKILSHIKRGEAVSGSELSRFMGISRQAVNKHLRRLIEKGLVLKEGVTKGAQYRAVTPGDKKHGTAEFRKDYRLKKLQEDRVFDEVALRLRLMSELRQGALDIVRYAFTEILNNAIDHSKSTKCHVEASLDGYVCAFVIRDFGIGIFHSIASKLKLGDESNAIGELIKGKTTTMRSKHSGEGIFFTSKLADAMTFRSHETTLLFDNIDKDIVVSTKRSIRGTTVEFSVSRHTRKDMSEVFQSYAPEELEYQFLKTKVRVNLFGDNYFSRSEARRIVAGLDKFKHIILDFSNVRSIGQSFADEIFRVFRNRHPDIQIETENLKSNLAQMIRHVVDNNI